MSNRKQTALKATARRVRADRPLRVLVVDPSPTAGRMIEACAPIEASLRVTRVGTLAAADRHLADHPVDVAVIEPELPDGSGLALHGRLNRRFRRIDTIVVSARPTLDVAMEAVRCGCADFLPKPIDPAALAARLRAVIADRKRQREQVQRVRKLRRACRKLDESRREVSQQVDVLCEDLVGAYHELAEQMEHAANRREYEAVIRDELDLEPLLRKTLSYLVDRLGPTNAAVFLPAVAADEFSLAGYVNYDNDGAPELLLDHFADTLAPRVAEHRAPLHLTDPDAMRPWLGDAAGHLGACELIAFGCRAEGEPLAAVVLFRHRDEPFDAAALQLCTAIGDQLAERLVKLIRVHHRASMADDPHPCDE